MKWTIGQNKKVGWAAIISRPVGDTCPSTCHFLNNGCYAERTERIYTNTRKSAANNIISDEHRLRSMLIEALKKNLIVRIHERGDFGLNDEVDMDYVNNWRIALESVLKSHGKLPKIWAYTHFYDARIVENLGKYISLYASVHNDEQVKTAKKAGFTLFAWCSDIKKGRKETDIKKLEDSKELGKTQVCPNLINKNITCEMCQWCTTGRNNIAFLKH